MNRLTRSLLGGCAVVALSVGGLSTAAATEKEDPKGDFPKTTVTKVDEKFTLPKGAACKDAIRVKAKETIEEIQLSERKSIIIFQPSKVSFYNPRTHKRIVIKGGAVAEAKYGKEDTRVTSYGKTTIFGPGIKGILYVKGMVKFTVKDDGTPDQRTVVRKITGYETELCKKLGTKPAHHDQGGDDD